MQHSVISASMIEGRFSKTCLLGSNSSRLSSRRHAIPLLLARDFSAKDKNVDSDKAHRYLSIVPLSAWSNLTDSYLPPQIFHSVGQALPAHVVWVTDPWLALVLHKRGFYSGIVVGLACSIELTFSTYAWIIRQHQGIQWSGHFMKAVAGHTDDS